MLRWNQYEMSAVVPYTSFCRETWEIAKFRLFSQVFPYVAVPFIECNLKITLKLFLDNYTRPQRQFVILSSRFTFIGQKVKAEFSLWLSY